MEIPRFDEHPFKRELQRRGLTLWQVNRLLGNKISDSFLCRMLNGVCRMDKEVETGLQKIIDELDPTKPIIMVKG